MISFVLNVEKVKHFIESFFSKIFYFLYLQLPLPPPPPELYPSTIKPLDPRLIAALGTLFHFKCERSSYFSLNYYKTYIFQKHFIINVYSNNVSKKEILQIKWKKFSLQKLCVKVNKRTSFITTFFCKLNSIYGLSFKIEKCC